MKKIFDEIIGKIRSNQILESYFSNYFFLKEPFDPPLPFILFSIDEVKINDGIFHNLNSNSFEINFSLKIFSNDYEFDNFSFIIEEIQRILDSFVLIENNVQISFSHEKTNIFHEYEKKKNKDFDFFKADIFFKAWYFNS
jgi:hypothetical protein